MKDDPRIDRTGPEDDRDRHDAENPPPPKIRRKDALMHPRMDAGLTVRERMAFCAGYFAAMARGGRAELRHDNRMSKSMREFTIRLMRSNWRSYWTVIRELTENPKTRRNW